MGEAFDEIMVGLADVERFAEGKREGLVVHDCEAPGRCEDDDEGAER